VNELMIMIMITIRNLTRAYVSIVYFADTLHIYGCVCLSLSICVHVLQMELHLSCSESDGVFMKFLAEIAALLQATSQGDTSM